MPDTPSNSLPALDVAMLDNRIISVRRLNRNRRRLVGLVLVEFGGLGVVDGRRCLEGYVAIREGLPKLIEVFVCDVCFVQQKKLQFC